MDSMFLVTDDMALKKAPAAESRLELLDFPFIISRFAAPRQSRAARPGLLRLHWEQTKSRRQRRARRRRSVRRAKQCCAGGDAAPMDSTLPRSLCAGVRA